MSSGFVLPPGAGNDQLARLAAQAAQQVPVATQQAQPPPEPVTVEVHWEHPQRDPETHFQVVVTFTPCGVILRRADGSALVIAPDAFTELEIRRSG